MKSREIRRICANSSCGDFSHLLKALAFLDEPFVLSVSLASHKCENSSTILEFAVLFTLDSAIPQNLVKIK